MSFTEAFSTQQKPTISRFWGLTFERLGENRGWEWNAGSSPGRSKVAPGDGFGEPQHRAYIATIFKGHEKGSAKAFENFYEAQCLWDEGMAQSLSEFLESPQSEGKTVLVFAGSGHIVFGFGIPNRLYRRNPVPYQAIVLKTWSKKMNGDLSFTGASSPPAHFLWITNPNPPEEKKPRIG